MKEFDALVEKVTSLKSDAEKSAKGNKSAGVRLRAGLQQIKPLLAEIRKVSLENEKGE